jgi:hypothetical protein
MSFGRAVFRYCVLQGRPGITEGAFGKAWSDYNWVPEDHLTKELYEAVVRGTTYLHPLLLWVGGASFPATLCKNGLFLCLSLLVYCIHTEGILKLYCSHTEGVVDNFYFLYATRQTYDASKALSKCGMTVIAIFVRFYE